MGDTYLAGNHVLVAGQTSATTTGAALPSNICDSAIVQNGDAAINLLVGDKNGQVFVVTPGNSLSLPVNNLNMVWVKSASSTVNVNWIVLGGTLP